ncbi:MULTISPECIES: NAD(P)/FAD-dependent oxidoreductase [unclassified Streptomyces]|uniref:NAD(P)/FAD-dependent oxidoreductase n=1 Tax=unclassified Streptomyces TaxID=2593676 RepID=UPI0036E8A3B7
MNRTITTAGDLAAAAPGTPEAGPRDTPLYDVTVVGAGVVGAAIARELARYRLRTALVEASDDIGNGTSKANTAILHTGFDAVPGSLEGRLVREGQHRLRAYAAESGIPVERVGALLVAWDTQQLDALPALLGKAERNDYHAARLLDADELRVREPHLGPGALGALEIPDESIICPWTTPLAYATQAVRSGVHLHLNCRVRHIDSGDGGHTLTTTRGTLRTRYLVNAAGLYADELDRQLGHDVFTVTPRRGQLIVFDKLARDLVSHILLPVPTAAGKGVLVAPTVFGNVLLGPTAEELDDKTATGSTADGLALLRDKGRRILPGLLDEEVTAVYAGLRAATGQEDYRIQDYPDQRYIAVGGIRSTGLTASLAIAGYVTELLGGAGLALGEPSELPPVTMPNLGEALPRPYENAGLIAGDPAYGTLVCHCERVSAGEIRDALSSTIPPLSRDGLRRRTRAGNGRCQGFYCGAEVRALIEGDRL